ncbi:proteasome 26S subunit [Blastocladiella britannica]|nr:proteasome 26S subunit [Blastocladiella britannica]
MSMHVDPNPRGFLAAARPQAHAAGHHDVARALDSCADLYDRKLWHQLSVEIDAFIVLPDAPTYLADFYALFVREFELKLNKLTLVAGIGMAVAKAIPDNADRIEFLTQLANRVKPAAPKKGEEHAHDLDIEAFSAHLLATTMTAHSQLLAGQFDAVAAHISSSERLLDAVDGLDARVSSNFYRVAADYYKAKAMFAKFYKTSLLFLACLGDVSEIPEREAAERAYELGLAALLSDEIYNFGELLMHPILDKLDGTPNAWLKALLFAFNSGDIPTFERMAPQLAEPLLKTNMALLRQKICLMALIDMLFKRTATERTLPFAAIAKHTALPEGEVEHLLMKALSLALIKGSMDQVEGTVTVTWVTPRVLDRTQIKAMADMIGEWKSKVDDLAKRFEEEGAEVFISA